MLTFQQALIPGLVMRLALSIPSDEPCNTTRENPLDAGKLELLRTKAEAQAKLDVVDAHVVQVPLRDANNLLRWVRR